MDTKAESTHNKPDESKHNKRQSDQSHESDDQHQNKRAKTNESFDMLRNTDSSDEEEKTSYLGDLNRFIMEK